jgi:hypothetical protein
MNIPNRASWNHFNRSAFCSGVSRGRRSIGGKEFVFSLPADALVDGVGLLQAVRKNPEMIRKATAESFDQLMNEKLFGIDNVEEESLLTEPDILFGISMSNGLGEIVLR